MAKARTDNSAAGELVARLNTMVARVVSANRKLRRDMERLSQRATAAKAPKKSVKRASRAPARSVKKTKAAAPKRTRKTKKTPRSRGRRR